MVHYVRPILFLASLSTSGPKLPVRSPPGNRRSFLTMSGSESASSLVGTTLPDDVLDEALRTEKSEQTSLRSILSNLPAGYKGIVMFLFPAVGTPYCTDQACKFSSAASEFKNLGYDVFGLTRVPSGSADEWARKHHLNYPILLDPNWKVIQHLKCTWMYFLVNRSHLVISRDAKILALERGVSAGTSSSRALDIVMDLP